MSMSLTIGKAIPSLKGWPYSNVKIKVSLSDRKGIVGIIFQDQLMLYYVKFFVCTEILWGTLGQLGLLYVGFL